MPGRKKRVDWERGKACGRVLWDNLDMNNPEWLDYLGEWMALYEIIDRVETLERYNSFLRMEGRTVSAWTYFETVKGLKYSPALQRMYYRLQGTEEYMEAMCRRPLPEVISCPLLEGVYKLAVNQRRRSPKTAGGKFDRIRNSIPQAGKEIAEGKSSRKGADGGTRRREKPCKQGKVKGAARETGHKGRIS